MFNQLVDFFKQFEYERLDNFLFDIFGKYRYVHALSERGLNCYLSNLRSVDRSHPDDYGSVSFILETGETCKLIDGNEIKIVRAYNMVDFKDPNKFINKFIKYQNLKAFL